MEKAAIFQSKKKKKVSILVEHFVMHVCMNLIGQLYILNVSCLIFWSAILEK